MKNKCCFRYKFMSPYGNFFYCHKFHTLCKQQYIDCFLIRNNLMKVDIK